MNLIVAKGAHDFVFVCSFHFSVKKAHFVLGKFLLNAQVLVLSIFQLHGFTLFHQRTNHIGLSAFLKLLFDESRNQTSLTLKSFASDNGLSAFGHFVDHRNIQITINRHR